MSKRFKEVFASMFRVSFLETIEPACPIDGTLDITIEEQKEDGSAWLHGGSRYVKVCHSQNVCKHYEIAIDPATGIGKVHISDVEAVQHVIVQVDETGSQMVNQDDYDISYYVNGEVEDDDYATAFFSTSNGTHHEVRIVNRQIPVTSLHVRKIVRDREGREIPPRDDMQFKIHICDAKGRNHGVLLNCENDFQCDVTGLLPGIYLIEEEEQSQFAVSYQLNNEEETTSTSFVIEAGENLLQVFNEERDSTSLTIEKFVRRADGELCHPERFEEFQVRLISLNQDLLLNLSEENDFCITLYGLEAGYYDLNEVTCDSDYEVSFCINGNAETCNGSFELNECEDAHVMVINSCPEAFESMNMIEGSPLRICKFIRRCDGRVCKPDPQDTFKVMVTGCGLNETFLLNCNNNWCVDIADLCDGCYEVCEVSCHEDYTTTYIVNDGCERTSAEVLITGDCANSVQIINEERNRGSVRITKYIRNEYGDLIKPAPNQCFCVTLSSFFCKRCFELNEENDWTMCFNDLRFGSYEVRECCEEEYCVSYQVNCVENRHARFVVDGCCDNEIKIINQLPRNTCGVLKINKFEETECGELVKPSQDEEFEVEVKGDCFCETYRLTASNNWCLLLEGLEPGEYLVSECNCEDFTVCYIVNREPVDEAFVCMDDCNQEVTIINHRKQSGNLSINAMLRDCDGTIRLPNPREVFDVLVESAKECVHVCLKASNGWCVVLDQLPEGNYRIIQKDTLGYKVSYLVNGKEETFARVELGQCDEEVTIINQENDCTGIVTVTKYMMDEEGNLEIPCPQDEFIFELKNNCFSRTYKLRDRNDFCIFFDDLEEGSYEICELSEGFDVNYRVNGEVCTNGSFVLGREDVEVDIINAVKTQGLVTIEKRIRRGDRFVMPDPDDTYRILLKGKGCREVFELNCENDFTICLEDLACQHYEVKEISGNAKCFDIDGTMQDDGYFLYQGDSIHITVINEDRFFGCMEICKKIEDEDGSIIRPSRNECFEILIESDRYKQRVVLDKENDFCVQLYDLPQGHYEITELDCDYYATYEINGLPCEKAIVDLCEQDVCVTVINHPCAKGCIEFQGCVEENGDLLLPCEDDVFYLQVCGKDHEQTVKLTCENDFCDCLCNLPPDSYTVTMKGKEGVRFEIEGQVFEDVVCIELNGEHVVVNVVKTTQCSPSITITKRMLNHDGTVSKPNYKDCFQITLLHNGRKQMFELDANNDFTKVLEDQSCGAYEIKEVKGGRDVQYQIDDECPSDSGYFEVGSKDVCVLVLNRKKVTGKLHLEAMLKSCDGELLQPDRDMCFYMDVDSRNMQKTFVLNHKNGWHQAVNVEAGMYQIKQQDCGDFKDLYYLVNGQKECEVMVSMGEEDAHVTAVNVLPCSGGVLELSKMIRDTSCNCLKRPSEEAEFDVDIKGDNYHQIITLNAINHFHEKLEGLENGCYEVRELNCKGDVVYVVNGGKEATAAIINICEDTHTVAIINDAMEDRNGNIEICKLLQDEEGCYRYPDADACFWIQVKGEHGTSRVLLNNANHFYASVRSLKDGWYEVIEENNNANVLYVVNNAAPTSKGLVNVRGNSNTVNVINPLRTDQGSIRLCKYMQTCDGLLVRAESGSYEVEVCGPHYRKTFTLNKDNKFVVTVDSLCDGVYVVRELNEPCVTYMVNGGSCVDQAIVDVCGNQNTVQIINPDNGGDEKGSITLAKYIREHSMLTRPSGDESFVFHVSKPNFNQLYTLNKENGWMLTLTDLEDGDYVITETTTTDEVTYIINGGSELNRAVVSVKGNSNTVQIINTRRGRGGSIRMEKFIRQDHALRKPQGDFTVTMHLSKPGYNETFILDQSNNWMYSVEQLENGVYVLDEISGNDEVTYVINGGSEVNRGIITVQHNVNTVSIIDAQPMVSGSIAIQKFVRTLPNETPRKPDPTFSTRVYISKPGYNEVVTLNQANDWSLLLENLEEGYYVVSELDSENQVTYRINGGNEVVNGVVDVRNNANSVQMINNLNVPGGSIALTKRIRDRAGNLVMPDATQSFEVEISGSGIQQTFTLNQRNNWSNTVTGLIDGYYEVRELNHPNYTVSFIVDEEEESDTAEVYITNSSHTVMVVNSNTADFGTLLITKYIKQADGTLIAPADGDNFTIEIAGENVLRTIYLNNGNNFTAVIRDLMSGAYSVREVADPTFITTYRVNGGMESSEAVVTMSQGTQATVDVLNERVGNQNSMEIFKYMLDADGNYLPPVAGQVFYFDLIGENVNTRYELNVSNNWYQSLKQYPSGRYEVREVGSPFEVQYLVNSSILVDRAVFEATPGATNVIAIINKLPRVQDGMMTLTKRVRSQSGELIEPVNDQGYVMRVTNGEYDEFVTLDAANRYTQVLQDLPYGTYTITEQNATEQVSFIINGGNETNTGILNIQSGTPNTVIIINTNNNYFFHVNSGNDVKVVIE